MLGAIAVSAAPLAATLAAAPHVIHPTFGPPLATGEPGVAPMLLHGAMPAVAVTIDGKGPFTLGIDTGAPGYLSVTKAIAQAIGLKVAGLGVAVDPSGRNPIPITRYHVGAATLAGLTFHDVEAEEQPVLGGNGPALDGVLGMNLFDGYTLVLDFKQRQVGLSTLRLPPADGLTVLDYPPGGLIRLDVRIGDVVLPAHLDTGQQITALMAPADQIPRLATRGQPRKIGEAHTVSETIEMFAVGLDAPVRVGAVPLPVTEVAYPTVVPVANIGSMALQAMTLRIDRPSRRLQLLA